MKKQILLVTSLLGVISVLSGCNENSQSDIEKAVEPALEKARESVNFNGTLTSIYIDDGDSSDEGNIDVTINNDFFEWNKTYKDASGMSVSYSYPLQRGDNGIAAYQHLTIQNEVVLEEFVNPGSDETMIYDDYCYNPFAYLEASDFTLIEGRYYLKEGKGSAFNGLMSMISTTMFNFYEVEVSTVSFELSNGQFKEVSITTRPRSDEKYNAAEFMYDASFNLIFPGEVSITEVKAKTHRDEHDVLKSALEKLQAKVATKNYTIKTVDAESSGEYGATYETFATEEGFLTSFRPALYPYVQAYENTGVDDIFKAYYLYTYQALDNTTQEVVHDIGDKVYWKESSTHALMNRNQLDPNFLGFAPEFFVKSGTTFTTTNPDVVDAIYKLVAPFPDALDLYLTTSKVWFKLNDDNEITSWGATATDYYSGYEDTFTYTIYNVGSTKIPTVSELKGETSSED